MSVRRPPVKPSRLSWEQLIAHPPAAPLVHVPHPELPSAPAPAPDKPRVVGASGAPIDAPFFPTRTADGEIPLNDGLPDQVLAIIIGMVARQNATMMDICRDIMRLMESEKIRPEDEQAWSLVIDALRMRRGGIGMPNPDNAYATFRYWCESGMRRLATEWQSVYKRAVYANDPQAQRVALEALGWVLVHYPFDSYIRGDEYNLRAFLYMHASQAASWNDVIAWLNQLIPRIPPPRQREFVYSLVTDMIGYMAMVAASQAPVPSASPAKTFDYILRRMSARNAGLIIAEIVRRYALRMFEERSAFEVESMQGLSSIASFLTDLQQNLNAYAIVMITIMQGFSDKFKSWSDAYRKPPYVAGDWPDWLPPGTTRAFRIYEIYALMFTLRHLLVAMANMNAMPESLRQNAARMRPDEWDSYSLWSNILQPAWTEFAYGVQFGPYLWPRGMQPLPYAAPVAVPPTPSDHDDDDSDSSSVHSSDVPGTPDPGSPNNSSGAGGSNDPL